MQNAKNCEALQAITWMVDHLPGASQNSVWAGVNNPSLAQAGKVADFLSFSDKLTPTPQSKASKAWSLFTFQLGSLSLLYPNRDLVNRVYQYI